MGDAFGLCHVVPTELSTKLADGRTEACKLPDKLHARSLQKLDVSAAEAAYVTASSRRHCSRHHSSNQDTLVSTGPLLKRLRTCLKAFALDTCHLWSSEVCRVRVSALSRRRCWTRLIQQPQPGGSANDAVASEAQQVPCKPPTMA